MKQLIARYLNYRKRRFITSRPTGQFAFVGMGNHSIYNLYPLLSHLRVGLKYIVTRSAGNAALIDEHFPHSEGTTDLNRVLADPVITGVFISTTPAAHFGLVKRALLAGKHVFVEKPPCLTLAELEELIALEASAPGSCLVGFQKHYAPVNQRLRREVGGKPCGFNYRYVTGAYPEGDPVLDLFIHPLALLAFLFGEVTTQQVLLRGNAAGRTIYLQTEHRGGAAGATELSTEYSWQSPHESLVVNTAAATYEQENTERLSRCPKPPTLLGIPSEKVLRRAPRTELLEDRNNFNPVLVNNQLYTAGYYGEIRAFLDCCAGKKGNHSSLASLRGTYRVVEALQSRLAEG